MTEPSLVGRDEAVEVLHGLYRELVAGAEWENDRLDLYLESLSGVLLGIENLYGYRGVPVPENPWEIIVEAFLVARDYE